MRTLRATPVIEATADDGSMPDRYSFKWEAVSQLEAGEIQTDILYNRGRCRI